MDPDTRKVESEFKIVKTRNSVILDIDVQGSETEEFEEIILEKVKKEYREKCENNAKIMLQIKLNGITKQENMNIDITKLKKIISSEIPVLHQEMLMKMKLL